MHATVFVSIQLRAAGNVPDDCDKDDATQKGVVFANEIDGLNVHRSGNNVMFADGHVELIGAFDGARMTYNPRRMEAWGNVSPN